MKVAYWRKTDNSGMLYPMIMTLSQQSNFTLSATLSEKVEPDLLLSALKSTYERYRMFKVELNNGFLRACFVENFDEPKIFENNGVILGRINVNANNGYLIRITYYEKRIFGEFFHGLTDGGGATHFFSYLLSAYVSLKHGVEFKEENFPRLDGEEEDAYERYYDKSIGTKGVLKSVSKNAAQVKGKFFRHDGMGVISGSCDFQEIKALSKDFGCSVTSLLGAFALSACVNSRASTDKNAPAVMFPINLRKFFPSDTLLNFVCMETISVDKDLPKTPREYAKSIGKDLKERLNQDHLKFSISVASTVAHNPVVKFAPSFLKRSLIVLGRSFVTKTKQTIIVSNLGSFDLPKDVEPYVLDVEFLLNCNERTPLNMAVLTYKGKVRVSFTRHILENDVERKFFEQMRAEGIDFTVRSNYREIQL